MESNKVLRFCRSSRLELLHQYKIYLTGGKENFMTGDNGTRLHRILFWKWKLAVASDNWYANWTFKIAPLFLQVYIIPAKTFDGVIPILYALLTNKQQSTCTKMFEMLKDVEPTLNPTFIICNFEWAAVSDERIISRN